MRWRCRTAAGEPATSEHGSIYWTPEHGAFEVHGDIRVKIRVKWARLGGHDGILA